MGRGGREGGLGGGEFPLGGKEGGLEASLVAFLHLYGRQWGALGWVGFLQLKGSEGTVYLKMTGMSCAATTASPVIAH